MEEAHGVGPGQDEHPEVGEGRDHAVLARGGDVFGDFRLVRGHGVGSATIAAMPEDVIYLDNHATTRPDPRVVEAMLPYLQERYGNPSARTHAFGQEAADAVEEARGRVARALGAEAREITFTSGATESNRLAIEAALARSRRAHAVVSAIEHRSVLDAIRGPKTCVKPGPDGIVDPDADPPRDDARDGRRVGDGREQRDRDAPAGAEIARICREAGVAFHCDATAAVGRTAFDVRAAGADFVSFSAHKIHGPKGIGGLYARAGSGRAVSAPGDAERARDRGTGGGARPLRRGARARGGAPPAAAHAAARRAHGGDRRRRP